MRPFTGAMLVSLCLCGCVTDAPYDPYGEWRGDYAGEKISIVIGENNPGRIIGRWGGVGFSGEVSFSGDDIALRFLSNLRATTLQGHWTRDEMELWSPDCDPCRLYRSP